MTLSGCKLCDSIILCCILYALIRFYAKFKFSYWSKRNVYCSTFEPQFPFGHMGYLLKKTYPRVKFTEIQYRDIKKKDLPYGGYYTFLSPSLLVADLNIVKFVMVQNFESFNGRGFYYNEKGEPLSAHLVSLEGPKWKTLRQKLTPTFSSGKLKYMFNTVEVVGERLQKLIEEYANEGLKMDIKNIMGRYTTDVIGSCAFGIECNSISDTNAPFYVCSKRTFEMNPRQLLRLLCSRQFPAIFKTFGILAHDKDIMDFFFKTVKDVIQLRETKNVKRNDFMQILIGLKGENQFSIEEIAAQAFIFFIAGYETSSATLSFALFELASNKHVQNKVREEIVGILNTDGLCYESVMKMKYLDNVIDESLRLYPPFCEVDRVCNEACTLPNSNLAILPGQRVKVPVFCIQRDPEYFPHPDEFMPERFSEENKSNIIPYTYLPFGEGPRTCIGMRFAQMQIKIVLCQLLSKFSFDVDDATKMPIEYDEENFCLAAKGKIWLKATKL